MLLCNNIECYKRILRGGETILQSFSIYETQKILDLLTTLTRMPSSFFQSRLSHYVHTIVERFIPLFGIAKPSICGHRGPDP